MVARYRQTWLNYLIKQKYKNKQDILIAGGNNN